MYLSYWEIFGIVLVTLYFVLSLLFPKTENSNKEQQKPDREPTSTASISKDHEKASERSVFVSAKQRYQDDGSKVVCSSYDHRDEAPTQQEVSTELHRSDYFSSKHQEDTYVSEDNESSVPQVACASVKDTPPNQPLKSNLSETPSHTNLSELSELPDNSLSTLNPLQKFIQSNTNRVLYVNKDEPSEQKVREPEEPSKYLYKEFKNGKEGLPPTDVSIAQISDSTDKFCANVASREIDSFKSENLQPVDAEIMNSAEEITSDLRNNNNLDKFADGLATSAIETAVDNSVCLNNFAENLSEKIFWASADDVISEVNASIEKQQQEGTLEPVKLQSLSSNVASEVVNEAIGEAALREEYMIEKAPDAATPKIQPHLGSVVENVVNNAICEAALRLKKDEDRDDMAETEEDASHILESESSNISVLPESSAEAVSIDDSVLQQEQSQELLKKPSSQNEDQQIQSTADEISINKTQEVKLEGNGHVNDTCIKEEKFTNSAESLITVESNKPTTFDDSKFDSSQGQSSHPITELSVQDDKLEIESQDHDLQNIDQEKITDGGCSPDEPITSLPAPEEAGREETKNEIVLNYEDESKHVHRIEHEELSNVTSNSTNDDTKEVDDKAGEMLDEAKVISVIDQIKVETQDQDVNDDVHPSPVVQKESIDESYKEEGQEEDVTEDKNTVEPQIAGHVESEVEIENKNGSVPEIKLFPDKDTSQSSSESEENASPVCSPEQSSSTVTLREKTDENKDGFWRRSLILDLEEDFEPEESFSSPSSPGSPQSIQQRFLSEGSEELTDSEEDEIIDHDEDAKHGAVGGSHAAEQHVAEEQFDFYDYGSDDDDNDDDDTFDPVLTVDGLCISKQTEKSSKRKENLKSVGSHYNRAIVMDNGCGYIKLGYAGDRVPRVDQQTVSGIPSRYSMQITGLGTNLRDFKKFGSEAVSKAGVMHISHPMKAGMIDNWTDVEDIWEHMIFNELGAEIGENPIIMTEISQNNKKNREKMTEILFEHFNVPAMYLADQLPLSIYASGLTSGVCLSSGYSCSQAAVVYEGHTLTYTVQHLDIGGGHLTENLNILLRDNRGHNFTTSSGWQIVNDIKETTSFVSKDYSNEVEKYKSNDALTKYYTLPDGQVIDIGYECMSSVEPLFQPDLLMSADATTASQSPVHHMVDNAIKRCDKDLQHMCHNHIILSGGTTLLNGFTARLQHELHQVNHSIRKIRTPEHRRYSPWIGGSILGSLSVFDEQYVTMDEYGDSGPRIVHKKCF